jgi:hypothetical protein
MIKGEGFGAKTIGFLGDFCLLGPGQDSSAVVPRLRAILTPLHATGMAGLNFSLASGQPVETDKKSF